MMQFALPLMIQQFDFLIFEPMPSWAVTNESPSCFPVIRLIFRYVGFLIFQFFEDFSYTDK